ncbi:PSD1 and planctomycete cytochrome C domain-containing protein [Schlesneria paludicola]|uniref:PSD1 and planctomycete cytochrome C domain-containing protein n=1 Tax=Schlesneria paludicola TaxID=360056 RepID=UPI00029A4248|nr:PSD1 and planctomycete cytochrome C domain-containing protein [Schlesneria paludicola]
MTRIGHIRQGLLVLSCLSMLISCNGFAAAADGLVSFNRDVRPILADKCIHCHGPDATTRKAELRLDTAEGVLHGKAPAVIPGKPGDSPLVQRITSTDESEIMPPPESKKTLTDTQKEILKRWVEQGGNYQKHWAFETIRQPQPPEHPNATNTIDRFLNRQLQAAGLLTQPDAARETLIRRVSFTLTGLPPTLNEQEEFRADAAPGAYERMIDRYLASPRYGEEMAKHWLDVARYADTHGLHLDNERQMWAYRDWVIKAFNDNLPFDQFTIWQVAGDLLPNPTTEQLVATGFNRCNVTSSEGGSINDELLYRYAVERTTAVAQVWLGLTAGCAVCHDHKYDPITTKEFYSLYAFFNSAADPAMDGNTNVTAPFMKLPQQKQMATATHAAKVEQDSREWIETIVADTAYVDPAESTSPVARKPVRDVLFDDIFPLGAAIRSSSRNPIDWITDPKFHAASGRRVIRQAFGAAYNDQVEFKLAPLVIPEEAAFEFSIRVEAADPPTSISFGDTGGKSVTWTKADNSLARAGETPSKIEHGVWNKITILASDLGLKAGDRLNGIKFTQTGGIAYWDAVVLTGQSVPANDPLESVSVWRKSLGNKAPPDLPGELNPIIQAGPEKVLSPDELAKLRRYYLGFVARPQNDEIASARSAWETARTAKVVAEDSAPGTFIYKDIDKPRESFVMVRGQYDKKGDPVEPAVPVVLPAIAKPAPDARLNRLDLAKWLVAPENPLTARVTVNRLWQQVFGTGLVKTSFDFGTQGAVPSHPELLDWLASEYRASGWNTKNLVKLLLVSDAFRRQTRLTPDVKAADIENRLYARGPRLRLDAEQVRDNVLFVSGLIDLTMGGRGVRPYQPANIWEPVGYSDSNTRYYLQDHGESLYRRSIYVFLKRTAPPPFMSNFDAPNREQVCTVRERSNTPLQALQLMNDIQHFEAARALAERALSEGGKTTAERLTFLYQIVLSRLPSSDEIQLLTGAFDKQLALFSNDPQAAHLAIHVGESKPKGIASEAETAAWTMISNLILNTDEALNRN